MSRPKKVAIVGAGIVGLCVADSLLDQGIEVVIVEKQGAFGDGCSFGNGGIIVPSHFTPLANPEAVRAGLPMLTDPSSPFGVQSWTNLETIGFLAQFMRASTKEKVAKAEPLLRDLNLASRGIYEEMIGKLNVPIGYARNGLLMLCQTAKSLDGEAHVGKEAQRLGLKTEVLDRAGVAALEPDMKTNAYGGVYFHDDAHLTPAVAMKALYDRVKGRGAEVLLGARVTGLSVKNGKVQSIDTDKTEVQADEYVLASGAWTGRLAKTAGLKLPLLAGKGYGFTVPNPPALPRRAAILVDARIAVTPMTDGLRFVGSLELGPASDSKEGSPSKRLAGMKKNIPDVYPDLTPSVLDVPFWSGLRPCSPDGLPYIGRTKIVSNLIIATGHAMMGMSLGPITGRLVAETVLNAPTTLDLNLLSPDRYA